jgi:hypothetical protein
MAKAIVTYAVRRNVPVPDMRRNTCAGRGTELSVAVRWVEVCGSVVVRQAESSAAAATAKIAIIGDVRPATAAVAAGPAVPHHAGTEGRLDGPAPEHRDYGSFVSFTDPDGNGWVLQEIKTRLPGR